MEANAVINPYVPIENIGSGILWVDGRWQPPAASGAYYGGNPMVRANFVRKDDEQRSNHTVEYPVGPKLLEKERENALLELKRKGGLTQIW